ncbi:hypothetical protein KC315_g14393 [Hortaea werneckii]|nr:hypothetical protein KC315_g14393 [Hortaea werneckii]
MSFDHGKPANVELVEESTSEDDERAREEKALVRKVDLMLGFIEQETRAVSLALVNALGNLAQIYGAYLFPETDSPKYLLGFGVISGMCAFGIAVYILAHVLLRHDIPKET